MDNLLTARMLRNQHHVLQCTCCHSGYQTYPRNDKAAVGGQAGVV